MLSPTSALPTPSTPPRQAGKAKVGGAMRVGRARWQPNARPLPQPAPTLAWGGAVAARAATRTKGRMRRGAAVVIGRRASNGLRGAGDNELKHAALGAGDKSAQQSHGTERNDRAPCRKKPDQWVSTMDRCCSFGRGCCSCGVDAASVGGVAWAGDDNDFSRY